MAGYDWDESAGWLAQLRRRPAAVVEEAEDDTGYGKRGRPTWSTSARDSLNVRDVLPAIKTFKGDPKLAAGYLPTARAILGELENHMALGGIAQGARVVQLPDGTRIRAAVNGEVRQLEIDANSAPVTPFSRMMQFFVLYPCNTSYPYGIEYSTAVDGSRQLENMPRPYYVNKDPFTSTLDESKFFTFLQYQNQNPTYRILNRKSWVRGNHFFIGVSKTTYSFWFADRGDLPAPVIFLFPGASDIDLDNNAPDDAFYGPYLLYQDAAKFCYGLGYTTKSHVDPTENQNWGMVSYVYADDEVIWDGGSSEDGKYVLGVGELNGTPIIIYCFGGFTIKACAIIGSATVELGTLASINITNREPDMPANFKWKFSADGSHVAGLYYQYTPNIRQLHCLEYSVAQAEAGITFTELRHTIYEAEYVRTVVKEETTTYPYDNHRAETQTVDYDVRVYHKSPIALYYVDNTLKFVEMEYLREEAIDASYVYWHSNGNYLAEIIYYNPCTNTICLPDEVAEYGFTGCYTTLYHCFRYRATRKVITGPEYEYVSTTTTIIKVIRDNQQYEITHFTETDVGSLEETARGTVWDFWSPDVVYGPTLNKTAKQGEWRETRTGTVGQLLYLNAELGEFALAQADHQHIKDHDEIAFEHTLISGLSPWGYGPHSGTTRNKQKSAKGYTNAVDTVTVTYTFHSPLATIPVLDLQYQGVQELFEANSITWAGVVLPPYPPNMAFSLWGIESLSGAGDIEYIDNVRYGSVGFYGSSSLCISWAETQKAMRAATLASARCIYVFNLEGRHRIDAEANTSRIYNTDMEYSGYGPTFRFIDSSFVGLESHLPITTPTVFPIRWGVTNVQSEFLLSDT